jgi:hypothetical protein
MEAFCAVMIPPAEYDDLGQLPTRSDLRPPGRKICETPA